MFIDKAKVHLEIKFDAPLNRNDSYDWLSKYQIIAYTISSEGRKQFEVARASIIFLDGDINLNIKGSSLPMACDAHSEEIYNLYETIFDENEEIIKKPLDQIIHPYIWYIDYLYVHSNFRRNGLGTAILEWIMNFLCRYQGAVIALPCSIELKNSDLGYLELISIDDEELKSQTKRFLNRNKFYFLEDTPYMYHLLEWESGTSDFRGKGRQLNNVLYLFEER
ncbi:GNAT family N-acetyltransferase [Desulfocucumis palustris]|uniref:GNAT family N-acetyltransferase n=1 Tax=Desulfocucumis palustris TaxID=1898651 RepID=UPI000CEA5F49|nr:GNAT family N-acetyltransferase [Desulfocucumis palustris]